jgi:hypothetical protein
MTRTSPRRRRFESTFAAAVALVCASLLGVVIGAQPCSADLFYVQQGGVNEAVGCTAPACTTQTFDLAGAAEVFGTLEIDTAVFPPTLSFDLTLWHTPLQLLETVAGTEDNGVAEIEFSDVAYSAQDLPATEMFAGSFSIDFGATATVDGDQTQWNDADFSVNGTPAFFADPDVQVTGSCLVVAPGDASCSLSFGTGAFQLDVGDPVPAPRSFRHTLNLVLLPEPGEEILLVSGVLGLLALGRRRIARAG